MKILGIRVQDYFNSASSREAYIEHLVNTELTVNFFGSYDDAKYMWLFYRYAVSLLPD